MKIQVHGIRLPVGTILTGFLSCVFLILGFKVFGAPAATSRGTLQYDRTTIYTSPSNYIRSNFFAGPGIKSFFTQNTNTLTDVYGEGGTLTISLDGGQRWDIWVQPAGEVATVPRYFAANYGQGVQTNSTDFGDLLQSCLDRDGNQFTIFLRGDNRSTNVYTISNTVTITTQGTITGEGNPNTVIRAAPGLTGAMIQVGTDAVATAGINRFRHLRLEGDPITGDDGVGVKVVNSAEPIFENVEFNSFPWAGLQLTNITDNHWSYVRDCFFVLSATGTDDKHGILINREPDTALAREFAVINCYFGIQSSGTAIAISNHYDRVSIIGSRFKADSPAAGIGGIVATEGVNYRIIGNTFYNWEAADVGCINFVDRGANTNINSVIMGNIGYSYTASRGATNLVYVGDRVQGVQLIGNINDEHRDASVYVLGGNNGQIPRFDYTGSYNWTNHMQHLHWTHGAAGWTNFVPFIDGSTNLVPHPDFEIAPSFAGLADGEVLSWVAGMNKWTNVTIAGGGTITGGEALATTNSTTWSPFQGVDGVDLQFRNITGGTDITVGIDANTNITITSTAAAATTPPAGNWGEIQYNNNGVFGAIAGMVITNDGSFLTQIGIGTNSPHASIHVLAPGGDFDGSVDTLLVLQDTDGSGDLILGGNYIVTGITKNDNLLLGAGGTSDWAIFAADNSFGPNSTAKDLASTTTRILSGYFTDINVSDQVVGARLEATNSVQSSWTIRQDASATVGWTNDFNVSSPQVGETLTIASITGPVIQWQNNPGSSGAFSVLAGVGSNAEIDGSLGQRWMLNLGSDTNVIIKNLQQGVPCVLVVSNGTTTGDMQHDITWNLGATNWVQHPEYSPSIATNALSTFEFMYVGADRTNALEWGRTLGLTFEAPLQFSTNGGTAQELVIGWSNQPANVFFASPDGSAGTPSFRAITVDDIPGGSGGAIPFTAAGGSGLAFDDDIVWDESTRHLIARGSIISSNTGFSVKQVLDPGNQIIYQTPTDPLLSFFDISVDGITGGGIRIETNQWSVGPYTGLSARYSLGRAANAWSNVWAYNSFITNSTVLSVLNVSNLTASRVAVVNAQQQLTNHGSMWLAPTFTGLADGEQLTYHAASGTWTNGAAAGGAGEANTWTDLGATNLATSYSIVSNKVGVSFHAYNLVEGNNITMDLNATGLVINATGGAGGGGPGSIAFNANQIDTNDVAAIIDGALFTNVSIRFGPNMPHLTVSRALYIDAQGDITNSAGVTATELEYLNDVTSDIQAQIDGKQATDTELTEWSGISTNRNLWTNSLVVAAGTGGITVDAIDITDGVVTWTVNDDDAGANGPGMLAFNLDQFATNGTVNLKDNALLTNTSIRFGPNLPHVTVSRALIIDAQGDITNSQGVTSTELEYLNDVTSDIQAQIDGKQALDADLTSIAGNTTGGFLTRTAADTYTARTITGTANEIDVANGDGVAGVPTLTLSDTVDLGAHTSLEVPNAAAPTVNADGEIALDTDLYAANMGALILDGGAMQWTLVGVTNSPSDNFIVTWDAAANAAAWEVATGGSGERNDNRDAALTNATRFGIYHSYGATTNYLRTIENGTSISIDNEGTNLVLNVTGLVIGTDVQAWDADLDSIAANATGGFITRTAADTYTARTITGTANEIDVTNGDGVSGVPTLAISATLDLGANTSVELPNAAAPTVDADGEIALDNDFYAANMGAFRYDGGAMVWNIVATTNTPSDNFVPVYDAAENAIGWEAQAGGSGERNDNRDAALTNATRIGIYHSYDATTNYLRTVEAGTAITLDNEGTNIVVNATRTGVYREVYVNAGAMISRTTDGAEAVTTAITTTGDDKMVDTMEFDSGATVEGVGFWYTFPDSWDAGTIKVKFHWTTIAGASGGVTWGVSVRSFTDDETIDQAAPASVDTDDTWIADEDMHISPASAAVTVANAVVGEPVYFEITRETADVNDTMAADAGLIGVQFQFQETTTEPAAW